METKFNPNNLEIIQFKITQGEIKAPFEFARKAIDSYGTDVNFTVGFNLKKKTARSNINFIITTNSKNEQEEAYAKFSLVFIFKIKNAEEMIEIKKKKIVSINKDLTTAIAAISFSTSRGILLTRLQGTVLKDYILPIMDPANLNEQNNN